ncbi:AAA family ATPase [Levilactobacillus yiduensis]|uniref:AAA family ATPase n=1 Tax=Levilactobacillus yiduensis TaxID=2953880 RepID=UPI0021588F88|nr:AAA family ATPase [Levilactobacillus yiduensis]
MKKQEVLNLIRYYAEDNAAGFRDTAYGIADEFDKAGDSQLAEYIMATLSNTNTFVPQAESDSFQFVQRVQLENDATLPLPDSIKDDLLGVVNAIRHNMGINRFLFEGAPGTGKTESVKQVARILKRDLFQVSIDELIDSHLGETAKNVSQLFKEINQVAQPSRVIVLFDELDSLAMDRTNSHDVREMGRATTAFLKGLDSLNPQVALIGTTNLIQSFDKALLRRFNSIIDFNRYTQQDLLDISELILEKTLARFPNTGRNVRLVRKIMALMPKLPYPGDLKNLIETSVAFSDPEKKFDYIPRLYRTVTKMNPKDLSKLEEQGFTIREIELLSGVSRSTVSRELRGDSSVE